ncbi:hypothetical protein [Kitasatospora sp. LaBMicrA B282]|uniref:hypothetical protein n=1 Tax=Kitasatospora sp. LaBMicrA B282 TaxID=3420949 RepID=UPI003D134DC2
MTCNSSWPAAAAALADRLTRSEEAATLLALARREFDETAAPEAVDQALARIREAVAVSRAADRSVLSAARQLLHRRAAGRSPGRLPRIWQAPGPRTPAWWVALAVGEEWGIWRALPVPGPELRIAGASDPLVQDVAHQARLLQASLTGHQARNRMFERYTPAQWPGVAVEEGRTGGLWVRPSRREEAQQAVADAGLVWERAQAYARAVLALLTAAESTACV